MTSHDRDADSFTTDKDRRILNLSDKEYQPHTWENLNQLISNNDLHLLTRYPSQLRKYREWSADTKQTWGTITNFVLKNRLHWEPSPPELCAPDSIFQTASVIPLSNPKDYKILTNDWPYGLDQGISHVIVWLKHRLPSSAEKGEITPESRALIKDFVEPRFCAKFGAENVLWFRNWTGIQSVKSLEHFHVLIRNADGRLEGIVS